MGCRDLDLFSCNNNFLFTSPNMFSSVLTLPFLSLQTSRLQPVVLSEEDFLSVLVQGPAPARPSVCRVLHSVRQLSIMDSIV